ncbi:MAG: Nif3-like dinuclear metal center hexameric protein [Alistipes sp.]|nr:Nif3-like dinuclear metal center hexameric protein [Alistipes sp.]
MKIKELIAHIEAYAPLSLQESYDNSGLNVGMPEAEITGVLLCVDVTEAVVAEARAQGANLIVSHHPLLFHPLRQVVGADAAQRITALCLREGISLYAAHTNLDSAAQGMSFRLGQWLGLTQMRVLEPRTEEATTGFGVVGEWGKGGAPVVQVLQHLRDRLGCRVIRHSALCCEQVTRIAICTGSGGSLMEAAVDSGAQLYVTADLRYNDFFLPDGRMIVADVGHFESEYCAIELLYDIINEKIANFALRRSEYSLNPVNYFV